PYAELPNCTANNSSIVQYVTGQPNEMDYVAVGVLVDPQAQLMQIRQYLAESVQLRRLPSQEYRELIEQLKPLCPTGQNPLDWLTGLIAALDVLGDLQRRYQQNTHMSLADIE